MDYSESQWRSYHHLHFIVLQNALKGLEDVFANRVSAEIRTSAGLISAVKLQEQTLMKKVKNDYE